MTSSHCRRWLHPFTPTVPLAQQIDDDAALQYFWRHLVAMLDKRRLYFMRDTRSWIFQYVVHCAFVLVGLLITRVSYC